jgi:hypothetical protein
MTISNFLIGKDGSGNLPIFFCSLKFLTFFYNFNFIYRYKALIKNFSTHTKSGFQTRKKAPGIMPGAPKIKYVEKSMGTEINLVFSQ